MKEIKGYSTIPLYQLKGGVWKTDFDVGPEFTKEDVKKIYADHEKKCAIILLKDGTEINPDFVCGGIYEERAEAWKQKIMRYKGHKKAPKRQYHKYAVYWYNGPFVAESVAVSPEKAINNVRWIYGDQYDSNYDFYAVEMEE